MDREHQTLRRGFRSWICRLQNLVSEKTIPEIACRLDGGPYLSVANCCFEKQIQRKRRTGRSSGLWVNLFGDRDPEGSRPRWFWPKKTRKKEKATGLLFWFWFWLQNKSEEASIYLVGEPENPSQRSEDLKSQPIQELLQI